VAITDPKYDVAISLLSRDEPVGAALHDRLSEGLEVFFYPRKQEDLAGTDGQESMRKPFLDDSRVVVVLYREGWGKTPWTGVEQTAIQDGCLIHGWHRLFFIMLDKKNPAPVWLPSTCISLSYTDYGIEQAVGAIKARVQESGGIITPLTAMKRAAIYEQEVKYQEDRRKIGSHEGIALVDQKVMELNEEIKRLCSEIRASRSLPLQVGANAGRCVLTNGRISLTVSWYRPYINSTDGCGLKLTEYNAAMPMPNERVMFFQEPEVLSETVLAPDLSRAREYGWVDPLEPDQFMSSSVLAEKCVIQFLDLAARADRGEISPPSFLR
jgi:hypothetical protein